MRPGERIASECDGSEPWSVAGCGIGSGHAAGREKQKRRRIIPAALSSLDGIEGLGDVGNQIVGRFKAAAQTHHIRRDTASHQLLMNCSAAARPPVKPKLTTPQVPFGMYFFARS